MRDTTPARQREARKMLLDHSLSRFLNHVCGTELEQMLWKRCRVRDSLVQTGGLKCLKLMCG